MPPILICGPITSEEDFGDMAVVVEIFYSNPVFQSYLVYKQEEQKEYFRNISWEVVLFVIEENF